MRGDDINHIEWLKEVDEKKLDDKKEQTKYKIKYIQEYAKLWIIVSTHRSEVRNINFIDCMCNAGIYKDGDLCTSMEVLSLFIQNAVQYPNYNYNLFLNDYDEKRIETTKIIANKILDGKILKNVHIYYSNESEYKGYKDFYNSESEKVMEFCKKNGILYHIKDGTITREKS